MKDKFDLLFSNEDDNIEYIAENYKAVSDEDKENIYNISKRKYNIMKSEEKETVTDDFIKEAEGVERYNRPAWHRWVSMSAASLILVGAISGGVLLAGSHKTRTVDDQHQSTEVSTQATTLDTKKNLNSYDTDDYMDELLTSWVKIQKAQFGEEAAANEELTYELSSDIIAPEEYVYSYTYHKVTEEGAETFDDLDNMMSSTYSEYVYEHLMGGDMSNYESGTRFGEETDEGRALRHFIKYGNSAYARWRPDYNFINMCDFENYDLVSSEFKKSADEFDYKSSAFCEWFGGKVYALKFTSEEFYEAFEEKGEEFVGIFDPEYDDMMLCQRVYKAKDGNTTVNADFLLIKQNGEWKIANFAINGESNTYEVTTEVTPTTLPEEVANIEENSGLQLHEQMMFKSREEAAKAIEAIEEKYQSGQYKFEKVDVDKYVNNMANSEADIDTLENKSFIYHMLLNSYRYFDTAEVEYTTYEHTGYELHNDVKVSVDNREKYMHYEKETSSGVSINYYQNGKTAYEIQGDSKMYSKYEIEDSVINSYDNYLPDNSRVIYVEDENGLGTEKIFFNNYFNCYSNDCLYPEGTIFNSFNDWYIAYIDQYLGRVCVGVELREKSGGHSHYIIDLKTGIVLKRVDYLESGEEKGKMEVKSIKINEPIEKKMFDLIGYTDVNNQ